MKSDSLTMDLALETHKLVRIMPEQIPDCWQFISGPISESLVHSVDGKNMSLVFTSLVAGYLEAWVLLRRISEDGWEDSVTAAVATLQIMQDNNTGIRSVLIYSLTGAEYLSDELWADMIAGTAEYGRANNCTNITVVSSNPRIIKVFKKAGASSDTRFMVMEIGVEQ